MKATFPVSRQNRELSPFPPATTIRPRKHEGKSSGFETISRNRPNREILSANPELNAPNRET
jgi:hypothetical protein